MDYLALKAEIESGPLAAELAPLVADGKHENIAKLLNRKGRKFKRPVSGATVKHHAIMAGWWGEAKAAAAGVVASAHKLAAANFIDLANDSRLPPIDLSHPAVVAMVDDMVKGKVMAVPQRVELLKLDDHDGSRADERGLGGVTHHDVTAALKGAG